MGRPNIIQDISEVGPFYLQRVPVDPYDPGGAYWGYGEPLYVAFTEENEFFTRAKSREEAKEKVKKYFKNAKFWR